MDVVELRLGEHIHAQPAAAQAAGVQIAFHAVLLLRAQARVVMLEVLPSSACVVKRATELMGTSSTLAIRNFASMAPGWLG